jgi:hypothetical protein
MALLSGTPSRLLKKTHMLSLRSIASLEFVFVLVRFSVTFHGHDHGPCAPRLWIFLSGLQEAFFSKLH